MTSPLSRAQLASERGAAAVEMALVLPVLLLVVLGMVDFGLALNAKITLNEAAREGARWAAIGQPNAQGRVADLTASLASPAPVVFVTGCSATPAITDRATVNVEYAYRFITPFNAFAGAFGGSGSDTITLRATGVMRCGG
jgi:Flp pilus assembly protein TadG